MSVRHRLLQLVQVSIFLTPTVLPGQVALHFEVASVRPLLRDASEELIRFAYGVDSDQVFGAPRPVTGGKPVDYFYEIEARAPGTDAPTHDQVTEMLRTLLADRFRLSVHRESRELSYDVLVIGRNGPKLSPAVEGCKPHGVMGLASSCNVTMEQFAKVLASYARLRVIDMTGLTGKFDIGIPFDTAGGDMGAAVLAGAQEHLGLRLETKKGPVETVIVDHVEAPTEN